MAVDVEDLDRVSRCLFSFPSSHDGFGARAENSGPSLTVKFALHNFCHRKLRMENKLIRPQHCDRPTPGSLSSVVVHRTMIKRLKWNVIHYDDVDDGDEKSSSDESGTEAEALQNLIDNDLDLKALRSGPRADQTQSETRRSQLHKDVP